MHDDKSAQSAPKAGTVPARLELTVEVNSLSVDRC